jgi:hypothetical protein
VGKLYTSELVSINGTGYTVEIWDNATTPTVKTLLMTGEGFTISRDGEGDKIFENTIRGSKADVTFSITDSTDIEFFQNMGVNDEGVYHMVIKKNTAFYWVGRILPDLNQWQRTPDEVFTISIASVDALKLLEDVELQESWFDSNGQILISTLIFKMLDSVGMTDYWDLSGNSSNFFADALSIHETTLQSFTTERIGKQKVSINAFYKEFATFTKYSVRSNAYTGMLANCKESLERLLLNFNARIILENGMYWIYNPLTFGVYNSITYNKYNTSGVASQLAASYTHQVAISTANTVRPKWAQFPTITHQAANKEIVVSHDNYSSVTNLLDANNPTTAFMQVGPLRTNTIERIQSEAIISILIPPNSFFTNYKSFALRIYNQTFSYDGAVYKEYNHENNLWELSSASNIGNSYKEVEFPLYYAQNQGLQRKVYQFNYAHDYDNGADYVYTIFRVELVRRRPLYADVIIDLPVYGVQRLYQKGDLSKQQVFANSNNSNASQIDKYELNFYDNFGISSHGQIFVDNNAGDFVEASAWNAFPTGTHNYVNDLVSVNGYSNMAVYNKAVQSISGDWYDNDTYHTMKSLSFDGGIWIWQGGTFNAQSNVFTGEWLRIGSEFDLVIVNDEEDEQEGFDNDQFSGGLVALDEQVGTLYDQNMNLNENMQYTVFFQAQTTDLTVPSQDSIYNVGIKYNTSNEELSWVVQELGRVQSLTGGTHDLDPTCELIICDATAETIIINLPDPATVKGLKYHFKKISSAHSVQLNGTIDGAGVYSFNGKDDCKVIMSDGTAYWLVAYYHK